MLSGGSSSRVSGQPRPRAQGGAHADERAVSALQEAGLPVPRDQQGRRVPGVDPVQLPGAHPRGPRHGRRRAWPWGRRWCWSRPRRGAAMITLGGSWWSQARARSMLRTSAMWAAACRSCPTTSPMTRAMTPSASEGVVPVPADLHGALGEPVPGRHAQVVDLREGRQQLALHGLGDVLLLVVEPGVVEDQSDPTADVGQQGDLRLGVGGMVPRPRHGQNPALTVAWCGAGRRQPRGRRAVRTARGEWR